MRLFEIKKDLWIDTDDILQIDKLIPNHEMLKWSRMFEKNVCKYKSPNGKKVLSQKEFEHYCQENFLYEIIMKTLIICGGSSSSYSKNYRYIITQDEFKLLMDFLNDSLTKK